MATMTGKRPPAPPLKQWLTRARWQGARWVRSVGAQAGIALAGALMAGLLAWHAYDMQQQRQQLQRDWQALQDARSKQASKPQVDVASADLARQLSQFYAALPSHDALPDQIKRLLANADKNGLQLSQADYKALPQANTAMLRYQIVLPVKAEYPKILAFLQSAMQEMPSLSLESMQLKRAAIDSTEVDARLQLVLFVQAKRAKTSKGVGHE